MTRTTPPAVPHAALPAAPSVPSAVPSAVPSSVPSFVPTTMRAVTYHRYGPPEVLAVERLPVPVPRPGEVLVRVGAVSVSRAETAMRAADPPVARLATGLRRPRTPVLGSELAGEVVVASPGAPDLRVGDRVVGATGAAMGGAAEYARVPAAGVVRVPDGLSDAEAVALAEGGLTALPFLRDAGRVRHGQAVCVNGASGAVGVAAVQLAADLGAVVTAVCSARNADLVRSLGATHVVDRGRQDVTAARGEYDVLFDAVGTLSFGQVRAALRPGGVYLSTVPSFAIAWHAVAAGVPGRRRRGRIAFTGLRRSGPKAADLAQLLDLWATGRLRPVLERTYALDDVVAAHAHVDSGRKVGTVVLVP